MRVLYIGNFEPPHSTENHILRALEHNGHEVQRIQENAERMWMHLARFDRFVEVLPDFILWTRTGWDYTKYGYKSQEEALMLQLQFLMQARKMGVPTVAYHLDIWHGLDREHQLDEPFFQCDLVITADGGHEADFAKRGINHVWFPPAIGLAYAVKGEPREEFRSPLAFVGSWQGHYHKESKHRHELVQWLQQNYARDCRFWPADHHPRIVGQDLADLYASVDLVIGDSAFAGQVETYWSDRIPETLGRGGLLAHPKVPGMEAHFKDKLDLRTWEAGNWDALGGLIEQTLSSPADYNDGIRNHGRQTVLEHHTYERRMEQLVLLMQMEKML